MVEERVECGAAASLVRPYAMTRARGGVSRSIASRPPEPARLKGAPQRCDELGTRSPTLSSCFPINIVNRRRARAGRVLKRRASIDNWSGSRRTTLDLRFHRPGVFDAGPGSRPRGLREHNVNRPASVRPIMSRVPQHPAAATQAALPSAPHERNERRVWTGAAMVRQVVEGPAPPRGNRGAGLGARRSAA